MPRRVRERQPKAVPTQETALVLADIPERNRLRELVGTLAARRDAIAELDLQIEQLRQDLMTFEAAYQARLQKERQQLDRIERLVHHFDRWIELLREAPP